MRSAAKVLKFPLSGMACDLDYRKAYIPDEETTFATPFALNVRGGDTFDRRNRGGSRPGLKIVEFESGDRINNPHEHPLASGLTGIIADITCKYRNRMVVASGANWYMSAIGKHTDWNFGGNGDNRALAVMGNVELAGRKGEKITALIPVKDKMLYIATAHSLWILVGDPNGGTISCVSEHTGCVSADAWAVDDSHLWYVSNQGMYALTLGENIPMLVSHKIPLEFMGLDSAMAIYDNEERAIHIFGEKDGEADDWFYDIGNKAFWMQGFPSACRPASVGYAMIDGEEKVVFKGADGEYRVFDDCSIGDELGGTADDSEIDSVVAIGPIRTSARDDMDGMIAEVEAVLAKEGLTNVDLKIYSAHSPEGAVSKARDEQGTPFTASLHPSWNNVFRPRQRGAWAVFVLSAQGRWGYESMTAIVKMTGRLR